MALNNLSALNKVLKEIKEKVSDEIIVDFYKKIIIF